MFACPLFREFRERNETAELKGMNIDTVATSIGFTCVGIVRLEFAKIKRAKIILHAKSITFRAAKLKGFTVFRMEGQVWYRRLKVLWMFLLCLPKLREAFLT